MVVAYSKKVPSLKLHETAGLASMSIYSSLVVSGEESLRLEEHHNS